MLSRRCAKLERGKASICNLWKLLGSQRVRGTDDYCCAPPPPASWAVGRARNVGGVGGEGEAAPLPSRAAALRELGAQDRIRSWSRGRDRDRAPGRSGTWSPAPARPALACDAGVRPSSLAADASHRTPLLVPSNVGPLPEVPAGDPSEPSSAGRKKNAGPPTLSRAGASNPLALRRTSPDGPGLRAPMSALRGGGAPDRQESR